MEENRNSRNGDSTLKFAIQETVFLNPEDAGIHEIKEIELVPEIEVLETNDYISITGCLQLNGTYVGKTERNDFAEQGDVPGAGGPDQDAPGSLYDSLRVPPFELEDSTFSPWVEMENKIRHRIPVNISIPLNRIRDLEEVYADVETFDYEIKTPHQLLISAQLLLSGIEAHEEKIENSKFPEGSRIQFVYVAGREKASFDDDASQGVVPQEEEASGRSDSAKGSADDMKGAKESPRSPKTRQTPGNGEVSGEETARQDGAAEEEADAPEAKEGKEFSDQVVSLLPGAGKGGEEGKAAGEPAADEAVTEEAGMEGEVVHEAAGMEAEAERDDRPEAADEPEREQEEDEPRDVKVSITNKGTKQDREPVNLTSLFTKKLAKDEPAANVRQNETEAKTTPGKSATKKTGGESAETIFAATTGDGEGQDEPLALQEAELGDDAGEKEGDGLAERDLPGEAAKGRESKAEDATYLTNFMRGEQETFAKLKMYIAQKGESLAEIAQRYEVDVEKLASANRLNSDIIAEGQVLLIPI
ncbi:hypothetical protein BSNK01_25220 [Bacillaceae bacterium]